MGNQENPSPYKKLRDQSLLTCWKYQSSTPFAIAMATLKTGNDLAPSRLGFLPVKMQPDHQADGTFFIPFSPTDHIVRSRSIPICKHIRKTLSEEQLCEDEAIADYRDYCMYSRIVGGISKQQVKLVDQLELRYQNDETLTNIIKTRNDARSKKGTKTWNKHDQKPDVLRILQEAVSCVEDDDWEPGLSGQPLPPQEENPIFALDM